MSIAFHPTYSKPWCDNIREEFLANIPYVTSLFIVTASSLVLLAAVYIEPIFRWSN